MTDRGKPRTAKRQRTAATETKGTSVFKQLDAVVWLSVIQLLGRQESVPLFRLAKPERSLILSAGRGVRKLELGFRAYWLLVHEHSWSNMPAGLGLGAESSWRNYREPEGLPTFSAAVKQLPGIQELVLSHVRTKPPALLFQLAPQLKAVHASTTARVGAFPVVQLFQSQPELQVLDLNGYDTYEPMVPNLVQALELHGAPALRQLRLGSLFTNKTELKGLFEAKWAGWDKLICLELPMWPSDAPALAALSKCTSLESVKIQVYDDHKDHDAAVDAVVACLADNCPLLRRLDVQAATGYFSPRSHPRAVTTASRFHSLSECIIGLLTTGREQKEHDAFLGAMAKVLQANPSMRILRVDAWQRPFEITVTKAFLEATIDVAPALQRLYVRADAALPAELTAIWFSKHPLCEWR